ncbi:MAG: hypothetical protein IJ834_06585 [Paludibacteraceae bacterium]|nr:hypothetical protein [Paludibacteraceae bacterium]
MEQIIIDNINNELASIRGQVKLLLDRAEQLQQTVDTLRVELDNKVNNSLLQSESDEPEVEIELIVDDTQDDDFEEGHEKEQEELEEEVVSPDDELLTDEELEEEAQREDKIVEQIEEPVENDNEESQEKHSGVSLPQIDDIRKAISIGDRFLFQRELFAGDGEKMNKTIDALNQMDNIEDALRYIDKKFSWDKESQSYELFVNILKRRY